MVVRGKTTRRHGVVLASLLLSLVSLPSLTLAQGLVPPDFFNSEVDPAAPTGVDANTLVFDAVNNTIKAQGRVVMSQDGYTFSGEDLIYNRKSGELRFLGAVSVKDPSGNIAQMTDLELTGGMKKAFINALTITSYDGVKITADSADYDAAVRTILVNANYAPCGECVDKRGQRIGWSMKASKFTYNTADGSLSLEQPTLSILGVPVAWLPYLWLPDTSESALARLPRPTYEYGDLTGHTLGLNYYAYANKSTDIILTPKWMSRQGLLVGAEWVQRFDAGRLQVKASGIHQNDPGAFSFTEAQKDWRGAIQASGEFTPAADWKAGWSYTAFTDAAYLGDYRENTGKSSVNQVYTSYLGKNTYFDARAQQFNLLGNYTDASQQQQGNTLPVVRFNHVEELGPGNGRVDISGKLLGVQRRADAQATVNGVPYTYGYEGQKQHLSLQAGWQTQWVGGGGFVATPYVGGRGDFAYYDGKSAALPVASSLWSATPIAAMDIRYPLMANSDGTVHIVEPIVQAVYRGSDTTRVGITNDDAQSFVFDDTNLFNYNRFSGSDRQETGLRANLGGRYQVNFIDGSYLELIAGQSYQIAGANAFADAGQAQTGVGAGVAGAASYAVVGGYGATASGLKGGAKLLVNTGNAEVAKAGLGVGFANSGYSASVDYSFLSANPGVGMIKDQHEVSGSVGVPIAEYWRVTGNAAWDLSNNHWLQVGGGVTYDDGYLSVGAGASRNGPTHTSPNATSVNASIVLKAPAGFNIGHAGAVPATLLNYIGF